MSKDEPGNQTANTPEVSETELRRTKMDELRARGERDGVDVADLRKEELVRAVAAAESGGGSGAASRGASGGGSGSGSGRGAEDELSDLKVDELRARAREDGVGGTSGMRKAELVEAVAEAESRGGTQGGPDDGADDGDRSYGAGPDGGRMRTGEQTSKSLKYSQEITSPEEEPEREGRSLVTTHHDVIKNWAEERGAVPATVDGTEHGDGLGVPRFDFRATDPDDSNESNLREVTWDEWFATFDERRLNFIYQEQRKDGNQSTFFRLESPEREDA